MINKVILIGNLGDAPVSKEVGGQRVAKFRLATNESYKMANKLRCRLKAAIKSYFKYRNSVCPATVEIIGCSMKHFINHLESKFTAGMNWSNHGRNGWVLDHIIPCSRFDLTDTNEQKKCFHYLNIQPLWEIDNFTKHTKDKPRQIKVA